MANDISTNNDISQKDVALIGGVIALVCIATYLFMQVDSSESASSEEVVVSSSKDSSSTDKIDRKDTTRFSEEETITEE